MAKGREYQILYFTKKIRHGPLFNYLPAVKWLVVSGSLKSNIKLMVKIDRYKARLVARGYSQVKGVDFHDILSPVVKMTTFHILFL